LAQGIPSFFFALLDAMDILAFSNPNPWCKTPTRPPSKGLHSTVVVLGRPVLKATRPSASMQTLSCAAAALAGSAIAIMKKTKQRPYVVRHAKDVPVPGGRVKADEMKAISSQSAPKNTCCSVCGAGASQQVSSRRQFSMFTGLVAPSFASSQQVSAETVTLTKDACQYCGGVGTVTCSSCQGSGELKLQGVKNGNPEASFQYIECPVCNGNGDEICGRCYGCGLPAKNMRGFLKDPAFQRAKYYMKVYKNKRDPEVLAKLRVEARAAVKVVEERKKAKTIEAASA